MLILLQIKKTVLYCLLKIYSTLYKLFYTTKAKPQFTKQPFSRRQKTNTIVH